MPDRKLTVLDFDGTLVQTQLARNVDVESNEKVLYVCVESIHRRPDVSFEVILNGTSEGMFEHLADALHMYNAI